LAISEIVLFKGMCVNWKTVFEYLGKVNCQLSFYQMLHSHCREQIICYSFLFLFL